jgi:radical SAM superfamily enzyme YgiQ (UPF0313 family)
MGPTRGSAGLRSRSAEIIRSRPAASEHLAPSLRQATLHKALGHFGIGDKEIDAARLDAALTAPAELAALVANACGSAGRGDFKVRVLGPSDERVVLMLRDGMKGGVLTSFGRRLGEIEFPSTGSAPLLIAEPDAHVSTANVTEDLLERLDRPRVRLVALYHPENFPLPRFALGIGDIARSLRRQMIGNVQLSDMQLGASASEIVDGILKERPDIVAISATFGQHDILDEMLQTLTGADGYDPIIVVGGSLAVLNAEALLQKFPKLVVALAAGELTMREIVRHFWGELQLSEVSGIAYIRDGVVMSTPRTSNRMHDDIMPDLDLLEPILQQSGVMQLESSRGCSYACSFCPRDHKGIWTGGAPEELDLLLPAIALAYERHPEISRKIFFVDEEFFGYRAEAAVAGRALGVATALKAYAFRFETSARIDQVYRPTRDKAWHVGRMRLWKALVESGLDRCLFGIESGVDSILERFNKKTTSEQNVQGLRVLSACKIPRRCTYITFDPLMSIEELIGTYRFQGRTDLLLEDLRRMPEEELFDGIHDPSFVATHSLGRPFYEQISYMLVSMECLIGSKYLAEVEHAGLADEINLNMGRREARYRDPAIGLMSEHCQRWVDRNFSFDYTLKSIEKVAEPMEWSSVHNVRIVLRRAAYELLGVMLASATGDATLASGKIEPERLGQPLGQHELERLMDRHFECLLREIEGVLRDVVLSPAHRTHLDREVEKWATKQGWQLINGATS